jgi:putative copper export protein/mono/diheme cytochrome c family protein/peroxiredoxin
VTELGLLARFVHLSASILVVGSTALLLLAGRSDRRTALAWESRVVALTRALVWLAIAAGGVVLAHQAATLESRAAAALEPLALARVAFETRFGEVWLVRQGLLLLLGAFVTLRFDLRRSVDWRAARGQTLLLAGLALGVLGAAGHSAAVEPSAAAAIAADIGHLLAGGVWAGALPALALLLRAASREAGADARPYAVIASRRFSRAALLLVVMLLGTGVVIAIGQVGSIGALLGTGYGRLLLLKLALVLAALGAAALGRRRLLPKLGGDAAGVGRPAMRRLAVSVSVEACCALAILAVVVLLGVSPPARHEQPDWPLSFRLALGALADTPDARPFVLIGSQIVILGVVVALCSMALRAARLPLLAGGGVLVIAGLVMALPPLATDAYPTTYQRPAVPYQASSIAAGAALYARDCATCHGPAGAGDGPAARALSPPPPDLRAHHATLHTAGDLYWWITHGRRAMPPFGHLEPDQRWSLVNYVRALAAAEVARRVGPVVESARPQVVAPDFTFAVGPTPPRALRDYRGARIVLVVLYTLPGSRPRLAELAARYEALAPLGAEIIAVPTDASPDAIKRLGADPRVFFPVVTEGAGEIVRTYSLFMPGPHAEFLVDRQGYLRALEPLPHGTERLLANVQALNEEKIVLAPPAEHVH